MMIKLPNKKYNIIYADPPWHYGSKSAVNNTTGSAIKPLSDHYSTMSLQELKNMPIKNMTKDDAACFMWVTDSHIDEALEVLLSWGFAYKTIAFNWVKTTSKGKTVANLGAWTMKNYELCLFGTKGSMLKHKQVNNIYQKVAAERTKHSKKPNEVRQRIEKLFGDLPRIELFARETAEGWDSWGNEVD